MKKLGIDIGATNIKAGIVENGKVLTYIKKPTNADQGIESIKNTLFEVIDELIGFSDENSVIGVSSTGDINPETGTVIYATDAMPSYTGLNIKSLIEKHTGRDATVINDCIAALEGEYKYGAAYGLNDVVMLTLGTGLGGAVMSNGELLFGSNYQACRLGHVSLYKNGRKCSCGKNGCAEAYVSATGLLKTANGLGGNFADCNDIFNYPDKVFVDKVVDIFTTDFAVLISNYLAIFDAEKIIIGGGLIFTSEHWWDMFTDKLENKYLVVKAQLGNDSGLIGATCLDMYDFNNRRQKWKISTELLQHC